MKYIHGLTKANLAKWKNKKWYHQRFDGCPYFLHLIAEAQVRKEGRKGDGNFVVHYCFFDNNKADWYMEIEDIKKIYTSILERGKNNPSLSKQFLLQWEDDEKEFYNKCIKVKKTNLGELSNEKLIQLHDEFIEIILNRNTSSSLIDGFALGTDTVLAQQINEAYKKSNLEIKGNEVFAILTAPIHLSFINEAEVALLEVAKKVQKTPLLKQELLQQHQRDYFWIHNNYVDDNVLTIEYFEKELDKFLTLNLNVSEEISNIKLTPHKNRERKEYLLSQLNLLPETKLLIEISEDFTKWQDERKKVSFWTTHYLSLILQEISNRTNIDLQNLKYCSPREVSDIFNKKPEHLEQRKTSSVFFWNEEGHECLTGEDARVIKKELLGDTDYKDIDDFRGLTACMGNAIGPAKVVLSAKEIDKVQEGDVLVAVMTRPDYVPAMKRASAIVTDEGGVTCHAAIVARELGIPCIIGTKIATKTLKDHDLIEVNANHGWVRKVQIEP